jgi:hypothetical protein
MCPDPAGSCVVRGVAYASGSTAPDPNSCNTCTCEDGALSTCTEAYCPILSLVPCPEVPPPDFPHDAVAISNGYLTVDVTYSGGCETHTFELCYEPVTANEEATLHLSHDDNGDACDSVVSESLVFDLYPLTEAGHDEVMLELAPHTFLYRTPN